MATSRFVADPNIRGWNTLPFEITEAILLFFIPKIPNGRFAQLTTVSHAWAAVLERHIFTRLKLTCARLADFDSMTKRRQQYVRQIWFCVELEEYACPSDDERLNRHINRRDSARVDGAFRSLFATLSTWRRPERKTLTLDITVHSPSDAQHAFQTVTFVPD